MWFVSISAVFTDNFDAFCFHADLREPVQPGALQEWWFLLAGSDFLDLPLPAWLDRTLL